MKLRSILCSLSKTTIIFSYNSEWSDLKGIWKITHWSIYPPKILIFWWAKQYQFNHDETHVSALFTCLLFLFSPFSPYNLPPKTLLKISKQYFAILIILCIYITSTYSIIIFIYSSICFFSLQKHSKYVYNHTYLHIWAK